MTEIDENMRTELEAAAFRRRLEGRILSFSAPS